MTADTDEALTADITRLVMDDLYERTGGTEHLAEEKYQWLYAEDGEELGYDPEGPLLLRGERSGALVEVDVEVTIRRVRSEAPLLPAGDWVLWSGCGCPRGVAVAQAGVGEDITWRRFFDTIREIEAAKKRGDRLELMTHERYCAEVSDLLKRGCVHQQAGAPGPRHVAPARYALTVLHRQDQASGPGKDSEGDPYTGKTVCGILMGESELWQPIEARDGDKLCPRCEKPGEAPADVQGALL